MWYALNRSIFDLWFRLQFHYRVEDRQHEPRPPYLIIANHTSALDIPLVGLAVRAPVRFMSKHELSRPLLLRLWIRSLGSFFVRRGAADRAAVEAALMLLGRGQVVCVFPEGTRSPDGRLGPLRPGAAYLALRAGLPVLPIAIIGAHRAMPKGASWPRRCPVVARLGRPLAVPRAQGAALHALQHEWTARFADALSALLPPDQQGAARAEPALAGPPAAGGRG